MQVPRQRCERSGAGPRRYPLDANQSSDARREAAAAAERAANSLAELSALMLVAGYEVSPELVRCTGEATILAERLRTGR
jgi:hypothetical protein